MIFFQQFMLHSNPIELFSPSGCAPNCYKGKNFYALDRLPVAFHGIFTKIVFAILSIAQAAIAASMHRNATITPLFPPLTKGIFI